MGLDAFKVWVGQMKEGKELQITDVAIQNKQKQRIVYI